MNVALARNTALFVMWAFVFAHVSDTPVVAWPGVTGAGDVLPLTLTFGSLAAGVLAAWRASEWLARGRRT